MSSSVQGPAYLSSHSADVILSDIRPIKLNAEALTCINVLLDEFLYNVLSTSQSLTPERLRTGLLGALPTTLGKEALLEAEVELRAYWDRNKGRKAAEDDKNSFDLHWSFELLRLRCQAYSTLNESDEDPDAERLLEEQMTTTRLHPPSPALIAPASLYLTAILESMCEHILSNVGRVASRDSSRTFANVQDLFVALCEDDAIYGLFKTMNVYSQIEEMSKAPKARRSKSLSRSDKLSMSTSRTSSPYHDKENGSRRSSEIVLNSSGSRTSLEKARSMKKFMPARLSSDTSHTSHPRSESVLSEETQQTWAAYQQEPSFDDDQASLQEFDDLMRLTPTMKMSLTPDRLRTMEVYKQEKRNDRRPPSQPEPEHSPSRVNGRIPSLRHVDSIIEDEETPAKGTPTSGRSRTNSIASPSTPTSGRTRSHSSANSSPAARLLRKPSRTSAPSSPPPQTLPPPPVVSMAHTQQWRGPPQGFDSSPFPTKTRRKQVNRESLDLDAVMAGSDDEMEDELPRQQTPSIPSTPRRIPKVSATTRELMAFLDEGPPSIGPVSSSVSSPTPPKLSKAGKDLMDFLNDGPPEYTTPPASITFADIEKPKSNGTGRLQRMISKLSLGNEKSRANQGLDDFPRSVRRQPSHPQSILQGKASNSSLASMPRYTTPRPPPISPPASPHGGMDYMSSSVRSRQTSSMSRNPIPKQNPPMSFPPPPAPELLSHEMASPSRIRPSVIIQNDREPNARHPGNNSPHTIEATPISTSNPKVISRKIPPPISPATPVAQPVTPDPIPVAVAGPIADAVPSPPSPAPVEAQQPSKSFTEAFELRSLLAKATSAEECRLILDMLLTKSGVPVETKPVEMDVPYPSPSPSDALPESDIALEVMLVEFLLGSEAAPDGPPLRKKKHSSRRLRATADFAVAPPTPSMIDEDPRQTAALAV